MDEPSIFWQMVWANFVWAIATFAIITIPLLLYGRWKMKKMKAKQVEQLAEGRKRRPGVVCFNVPQVKPGHCPFCGQTWPLEGPFVPPEEDQ